MYITFQEIKYINITLTKINNNYTCLKLRKNLIIFCSNPDNGTKQASKQTFQTNVPYHRIKKQIQWITVFFTECVPTINILSNKLHMKVKFTRITKKYQIFFKDLINNLHFSQTFTFYTISNAIT